MLFTASVTGNVYIFKTFVNDVCALAVKVVDNPVNKLFITRYGRCRNYYRVVFAYGNLRTVAVCHTCKRAHRFALAARGYDDDFVIAHIFYFRYVNKRALGKMYFAYLFCCFYDVVHTSAR